MAPKSQKKTRRSNKAFPVVGIGASAGGVQALQSFFDNMPSDSGMAFIAVPHLDPTERSHMVEVLERRTDMHVVTAKNGQTIAPDCVYVIPPDRYLTVLNGKIRLAQPQESRGHRRPVDMFFHSLGRDLQERAVAIVMSGTGTNGASGLRTIKAEGGFILAQDPETATHTDMPLAATRTGLVDEVLAPGDMGQALMRFADHPYIDSPGPNGPDLEAKQVSELLSLLRVLTRHDFRSYKKSTILRRIHRRMGLKGFDKLHDYVQLVRSDDEEAKALTLDFMVTVTGFFRDAAAWKELEKKVIAPLVKTREQDMPIRIWVPGCATGEEGYSIGMLLLEHMEAANKQFDIKIFATDTSGHGLEFARNGLYPLSVASDVPQLRRKRFFDTEDDACRVKQKLRDIVIFAPQNVLQDPPFTRLDLVSCRNLLIYIEPAVQKKLLRLFHFSLREGAHLFLGTAETVSSQEQLFDPVSKKWRIFKRAGLPKAGYAEFPVIGTGPRRNIVSEEHNQFQPRRKLSDVARDALLAHFAPATVVIDRSFRVYYFHGDTGEFLQHPQGEPTHDLLAMVRDSLRPKLRAVVKSAAQDDKTANARVPVRRGGNRREILITVRPLHGHQSEAGLLIVTFEYTQKHDGARKPAAADGEMREATDAEDLEQENKLLRDELRSTIEQMESSNEELKASNEEILSMNEELQSSNEELETSKEELQSFNEELNTVNAQLHSKVDELEESTNDINNLLNSTDIATLFLDRQQRIRRYTPAMKELIELIPSDTGRPVDNLAHQLVDAEVAEDAKKVLRTLVSDTKEVRSGAGNWYMRRTSPYRTHDDRIDGVVITFSNITDAKTLEQQLRAQRDYSESVVETIRHPLLVLYPDLKVQMANDAFYRTFQAKKGRTVGRQIYELGNGQWDIPELRTLLEDVLPHNRIFEDYEVECEFENIGPRTMVLNGRQLDDVQLILLSIEDTTERKDNERQREVLVAELNHRVKNSLMTVQAIASQTIRTSSSTEEFQQSFESRLASLSRGHDLLMRSSWQATDMDELIASASTPFRSRGKKRFRSKCKDIRLVPQAALAFKLILHELATNSAKYGALKSAKGLVDITCDMQDGKKGKPKVIWRETGGPEITEPPTKKGFGTRLIERSAAHDLDGSAKLDYGRDGLVCTIEFSRQHLAGDK